MFLRLKKGKLNSIISKAITKAGSPKKLIKSLNISKSTLYCYLNEQRSITKNNLDKFTSYLKIDIVKTDIEEKLPANWRQRLGGKRCVESKKSKGTFKQQLRSAQLSGAKKLKEWHKTMKKTDPKKYYQLQYKKFKKIGGYKFITKRGEQVRNKLEKDVADELHKMNINYKYEPFIHLENKGFFPDFLIDNRIILECTMWRGTDKAIKLQKKIKVLKKKYKIYVIIPKALNSYYKILNNHLVLGLDQFVPVAQTFPRR